MQQKSTANKSNVYAFKNKTRFKNLRIKKNSNNKNNNTKAMFYISQRLKEKKIKSNHIGPFFPR